MIEFTDGGIVDGEHLVYPPIVWWVGGRAFTERDTAERHASRHGWPVSHIIEFKPKNKIKQ